MEQISIGNKVEIELQISGGSVRRKYISSIIDVIEKNSFILGTIMLDNSVTELPRNAHCSFVIYTNEGIFKHDGKITEVIAGVENGKKFNKSIIVLHEESKKLQRRESFRFNCEIDMKFTKFGAIGLDDSNRGIIIDLSAGGVKFLSNTELKKGDLIAVEVLLDSNLLFLTTEVMYVDDIDSDYYEHQYRCRFVDLLDTDKDIIIQYVLDIQRDALKKRKFSE